jgi:serine phosphatase RsbU (regulator of sigma subunit)
MYLVDVSGHGTGAAMHAVSVINVLRHHALPRTDFRKPAQVLKSLNEMFQMERHGEMCFTIWYGAYDAVTRTLAYSSAGHHPGYLVPPERRETIPLVTRNLVLGAIPGYSFKAQSVVVPQGSSLYLFSDGVFEILTHDGRQWGLSDFVPLILSPQVSGVTEAQRLYDAVHQMAKRGPLDDDFSMMVMTFQ